MAWAPDYVEVADLREFATGSAVQIDADEANLARAIAAASRAVDRHCGRQFGVVDAPVVRYYTPRWSRSRCAWLVTIDDLMTETDFEVAVEQYAAGVYVADTGPTLRPRNAAADGRPWEQLAVSEAAAVGSRFGRTDSVRVTALFGWTAVPVAVEEATLLQASRLASRKDAPFGIAGSPRDGSEMRLLAKVDPDVAVSLEGYVRKVWAR